MLSITGIWFPFQNTIKFQEKSVECFDTLPSKREVYEITTVDVKPDCWKKYIDHKGK